MFLFGNKRARTQKSAELRSVSWLHSFSNRYVVAKLVACFVALLVLMVAVKAWETPFPYRLGQRPAVGVIAQTDFRKVNPSATRRAKEEAADAVPYVFVSDSAPLRELPSQLRAQLRQLAEAPSVDATSPELRSAFQLVIPDGTAEADVPAQQEQLVERFGRLKNAVATAESLNILISEFAEFLLPLEDSGLLVGSLPDDVPAPSDRITIIFPNDTRSDVEVAAIELRAVLATDGSLGSRWSHFPALVPLREMLSNWIRSRPPAALQFIRYDPELTRDAKRKQQEETLDVFDPYIKGRELILPGDVIDEEKLSLLQTENAALEAQATVSDRGIRIATVIALLLVVGGLNGYYLAKNEPVLVGSLGRLSVYLALIVGTIAASRLLSFDPWRMQVVPLLAAVMILAIAYNQVLAIITAFSLGLILTLSTGAGVDQFVIFTSVCAVSVILLPSVNSRSTLIIVGLWAGITYLLVSTGLGILGNHLVTNPWMESEFWWDGLRGFAWCLVAGFLVAGSLPFIESMFGIVTNISLLELSDVSHPLLQELVRRAPGTYNHSISVATIGETAAESIGANGRLVRVGAYFHDVGKMLKPQYFIENMMLGAESRHDHLAPAMSTLIIIGHVKDGVDLARQHNLPKSLIDFIEQHHGTTLVEYFYRAATKQAGEHPEQKTDVEESSFRYPGPKPQSRELGVMMLSDAVESASRTLSEPTPARIERLVHEITMKRLLDGQFEECGLTLSEINRIEESLVKSLTAIYHGRIKYPEQKTA
ncbi:hypothetical protein CA54_50220 [Symmachiella macrocystis]|uniref:HD/PDEase domain-containing protein n=1 Tax=Symmachiella macrocystis TaxID=2527985 RepID=A0A5C6B2T0_9PLAN|nr:HDIG domain-containing metalloprotein [Symmachiella macrocystis]TWU06625.1 hypothetical protein CA54_50220 [Symmachiella macrocystis]